MFYRVRQFYQAFFPQITSKDLLLVHSFLPEAAVPLFKSQSLADQRHALDVAFDLKHIPNNQNLNQNRNLIIAALLHDCGKTCYPLKIWQRVYIVLCARLPKNIQEFLLDLDYLRPFSMPLRLASEHPYWGADLAYEAGLNDEVVQLIRRHHTPHSDLEKLLYWADNRH